MSTQNANAVAITGGTITGTTIDGSNAVAGSSISGTVAIANGGTGATSAATARSNLGTNDAGNLTAGTLSWSRLPASGVAAGTYNWGTVNSYGLVTAATNTSTSSISQDDSGVFVTDAGTNGTLTFSRRACATSTSRRTPTQPDCVPPSASPTEPRPRASTSGHSCRSAATSTTTSSPTVSMPCAPAF